MGEATRLVRVVSFRLPGQVVGGGNARVGKSGEIRETGATTRCCLGGEVVCGANTGRAWQCRFFAWTRVRADAQEAKLAVGPPGVFGGRAAAQLEACKRVRLLPVLLWATAGTAPAAAAAANAPIAAEAAFACVRRR